MPKEQLTIESNGTGAGTRITTSDGYDLSQFVEKVTVEIDGGGVAKACLHVFMPNVKMTAEWSEICRRTFETVPMGSEYPVHRTL